MQEKIYKFKVYRGIVLLKWLYGCHYDRWCCIGGFLAARTSMTDKRQAAVAGPPVSKFLYKGVISADCYFAGFVDVKAGSQSVELRGGGAVENDYALDVVDGRGCEGIFEGDVTDG